MQSTSLHPLRRIAIGGVAVLAGATFLAACSSSKTDSDKSTSTSPTTSTSSSSAPGGTGSLGELTFSEGWVRQPAMPDMAAGYVKIANSGSTADELVSVSSDSTTKIVPMDEVTKNGVGTMVDIPKVAIPANGTFDFVPGHAHLMLYLNGRTLKPGDQVTLTLTFAHNGTVKLTVPVKPRSANDKPMTHVTGSTSGMPGMGSGSASPGMATMTNMSEGASPSGPTG